MTIVYAIAVLGVLAIVFGLILAVAAKVFEVEVDPRLPEIQACLAGANCGGCGYPGCDGYAAAVAAGKAPVNCCVAGGQAAADQIAEIMGVSAGAEEKMVAFVPCSGAEGVAVKRFNYSGPQDCQAAMLFGGKSNKECRFACIGLGNCARACKFGAMHIVNGVAKVDRDKCVGCMACADACPKKIIELRKKWPKGRAVYVGCVSKDKGAVVMKACKAGCIGCGKCVKVCAFDAITVENNLAYIDPQKCKLCRKCVNECPTGAIKLVGMEPLPKTPKAPAAKAAEGAAVKAETPAAKPAAAAENSAATAKTDSVKEQK